jgi:hypothetical protein
VRCGLIGDLIDTVDAAPNAAAAAAPAVGIGGSPWNEVSRVEKGKIEVGEADGSVALLDVVLDALCVWAACGV